MTPRHSAVWMVLFSWLVHTFRSTISCSSMNFFSAWANWEKTAREGQEGAQAAATIKSIISRAVAVTARSSCGAAPHRGRMQSPALALDTQHYRYSNLGAAKHVPASHAATDQNPHQSCQQDYSHSHHVGKGRWYAAGHECSLGNRRFYSGCNLGLCLLGTAVPH